MNDHFRGPHGIRFAAGFVFVGVISGGCDGGPTPTEPVPIAVAAAATPVADSTELSRIQTFLNARYATSDVQYSFHTIFGETIDCIDFFSQPGVKQMAAAGRPLTNVPVVSPPPVSPHPPKALQEVSFNGQLDDEGHSRACPG